MSREYDPELAPLVAMIPRTDLGDVVAARRRFQQAVALLGTPDDSGVAIRDEVVPRSGAPDVPLRVYRPADPSPPHAAILFMHSGGYVLGSLDTEHASCVDLCRALGATVVSVDYRLAPENPYPAALTDCRAALEWTVDKADLLEIDPGRLVVRGLSAGGGLAAALTLQVRDEGGPRIQMQSLVSPQLDDRMRTESMRLMDDTPVWTRTATHHSWQAYLGGRSPGASDVPLTAAPARAEDLAGLPPAHIAVAEHDPLRDEAIVYAANLREAGVPVELHHYPGTFHGSALLAPDAQISRRQRDRELAALRTALEDGASTVC